MTAGRTDGRHRTACGSASSAAAASADSHARGLPGQPAGRAGRRRRRDPRAGGDLRRATTRTTAYGSIAELADQQPDLVSVATPPGSHAGTDRWSCCERGRSVLLEKPPTANLVDLDNLIAADEASTGTVYGVFQHRHGSGARRAHRAAGDGRARPAAGRRLRDALVPAGQLLPAGLAGQLGRRGWRTHPRPRDPPDRPAAAPDGAVGPRSQAQSARLARPVEFEDVSLAMVTFASGAVGTIVTSLLSPRELSRIRIDTTGGTLEVDHLYGYRDADWSWSPAPDASTAARNGRDPGRAARRQHPTDAGRRRVGRQPDPSTCPATTPPRSTGWSTTCSPAAGTRPRWPAPVPRWSSSPRCTRPRSTGETVHRRDLVPGHRTTPASTVA